ncbi:helix-turn-helix domain-containing protein [Streptomyces xiamenensis]
MVQKIPPTIRQRRLGAELRRLREQAGLTATKAGEVLGITQSRVSSIESGSYAVSAERVRAMARAYDCGDRAFVDALTHLTGGRTRGWWEEYREILPADALELAELEHHATAVRIASVIHMPGLLQTTEHARAVISDAVPPMELYEVEHRVSYRIKRQAVLHGDHPTSLSCIVHEAALRMGFGGPEIARGQLDYLLSMSERENISVQVIPFGAGTFPSSGQGVIYLTGDVSRLDTVQLDTDHGSQFLDAGSKLDKYRRIWDRMEACSLDEKRSRDVIRRAVQDI